MSLIDAASEEHARLAAIKAIEAELTHGTDEALRVLGPAVGPIRVRAAIGILLRAKRHQQAADLICDQHPDEHWLDVGACVFGYLGDVARANALMTAADASTDSLLSRRTRLGFAEGIVDNWQDRSSAESLLANRSWSDADSALAETALDALDPLLSKVRADRAIKGELERSAELHALFCAHVLNNQALVRRHANWLLNYRPVPLIVAEVCLRRMADCPENLPNRLRLEHPGDFQAGFLAAAVERELLDRPEAAFDSLALLAREAEADEQKDSVCNALFETCGRCQPDNIDRALSIIRELRPNDSTMVAVLLSAKHMAHQEHKEARLQLDAVRDESSAVWWQVHAQLCEREGNEDEAQAAWERASGLLPHPEVLRRSVRASLDRRRFESAVRGLKSLLATTPDSKQELSAIVAALVSLGDFPQAADYLARLVELEPSEYRHRVALAQCLARCARLEEAISVLQPVCATAGVPLEALLLQSELLEAAGRTSDGFRLLDAIAGDHWDDPHFLMTYVKRGYAASEDKLAHEAFARLLQLRQGGRVSSDLLQEGTLEELLEYGRQYQQQRESLQSRVIDGRMPWLLAEEVLGNPPLWAWMLHTQKLAWLSEDRHSRAAYSIYSTNSFTVTGDEGRRSLSRLRAPARGTDVVIDLSALLTIYQLGRLRPVAEYFGRISLPASYGDLPVRDGSRFGRHQPSREAELIRIRGAIDNGRIAIANSTVGEIALLDEYHDEQDRYSYRLVDVIGPLEAAQKADRTAIIELRGVAHKPSAADASHPGLELGARLLVDLATLRTLANGAAFEPILQTYAVHLSSAQRDELAAELSAHERSRTAREVHDALWRDIAALAQDGKVSWVPVPSGSDSTDDRTDELEPPTHLDALTLADRTGCALLVDDRVLQVAILQRDTSNSRAFGTDRVLEAMVDQGTLAVMDAAKDLRCLMNWRYRFLVPSSRILFTWAEQNLDNPPGDALLDAAVYLHDCLRDPGLHCGLEQTDPPMPMAARFVTAWIDSILSCLADIWKHSQFSDTAAVALTRWIGEELVPSCPRGLTFHQLGINLAQVEHESFLSMAFVKFAPIQSRDRANQGLRTLAASLGMAESEFFEIAAEAIDVVSRG